MRPLKKTYVIFCEGRYSEPDYISGIKQLPHVAANSAISIEIDSERGVPLKLVQRAIERSHEQDIDECWCVFDVEWPENHPNLIQAITLAQQHGIKVAVSNPSFELWLSLHFEDSTRFVSTENAERRSKQLDGRSGKRIDASIYMPRRAAAVARARALDVRHARNEVSFPRNNPSSSMADLLEAIDRQPPARGGSTRAPAPIS
ncbi:RloB family protein [Frankia sp. Ag45/Mut15]|uniref:RloB family protein n=1 Tax=Frankia umida TaxID=573489 RepID=A0ABT0JZI4_9ACTN|nr:RloB family protein [Frankia umida]MCK9876865.1 RloB family protein [Frankia umida]